MKKIIIFLYLVCSIISLQAQTYQQEILKHRAAYKQEFVDDKSSPLKKDDLSFLRFYEPNPIYKVKAHFEKIDDTIGFDMQTHSGKIKRYFVYGAVSFSLSKKQYKLYMYQSLDLRTKEGLEDYLFIPFNDLTNSRETFGGGRYLDFKMKDIKNNELIIDFNKCYNPYCAYAEGYSCPIPPNENKLNVVIKAGEKMYVKADSKE
jgi:uncharacterized protein